MGNNERRLRALEQATGLSGRLLVVSGPEGFDASAALFAEGITVQPSDTVVRINKPGNVAVRVICPAKVVEELHGQA